MNILQIFELDSRKIKSFESLLAKIKFLKVVFLLKIIGLYVKLSVQKQIFIVWMWTIKYRK